MSGLIISQLKDVSNDLTMTLDEESWFGKYLVHYRYTQLMSIGIPPDNIPVHHSFLRNAYLSEPLQPK